MIFTRKERQLITTFGRWYKQYMPFSKFKGTLKEKKIKKYIHENNIWLHIDSTWTFSISENTQFLRK